MIRSRTASAPFILLLTIACAGLMVASLLVPDGADAVVIWPCLAIFYAVLLSAWRKPQRILPQIPIYLGIEVPFLIFCYLIFFLPYQQAVLGLLDLETSRFVAQTFAQKSNQAILLSACGVVAFYLGVRWTRVMLFGKEIVPAERDLMLLPAASFGALTSLLALYFMAGWRAAGEGRYTGTSSGGAVADGVSLLITMFAMLSVALIIARMARRERLTLFNWLSLAPASYWCVWLLVAGDRNAALLIVLVAVAGLLTFRRAVGRVALILGLLVTLHAYDRVEALRHAPWFSVGELLSLEREAGETSFNITAITTRAALAAVPDRFDHGYGFYKLFGAAGIVPFVRGALAGERTTHLTSADVLTETLLPPGAGWNVGSNVIADIYLDFGTLGVPVVMFLIGRFAGWVRNRVMAEPFATSRIVLYLMTLALFAELPRYAVDFPVRMLVWTAAFIAVMRLIAPRPVVGRSMIGVR